MPITSGLPEAEESSKRAATCDSYAYTSRRGACGALATKLLIGRFAERRTQWVRLCDRHAAGVHEDVADPLFAYLRCTEVTETPIAPAGRPLSAREGVTSR